MTCQINRLPQRSALADEIHMKALAAVDEADFRSNSRRIDQAESIAIYRNHVYHLAKRRMMEELAPIHASLARIAAMRTDLSKPNDPPASVRELMDHITTKWGNVVKELLNGLDA